MQTHRTQHGYLALHAMMIHIWNLGEALDFSDDKHINNLLLKDLVAAKQAVQDMFDLNADDIIPDEDWDMANIPAPDGYRYEINVLPAPDEPPTVCEHCRQPYPEHTNMCPNNPINLDRYQG